MGGHFSCFDDRVKIIFFFKNKLFFILAPPAIGNNIKGTRYRQLQGSILPLERASERVVPSLVILISRGVVSFVFVLPRDSIATRIGYSLRRHNHENAVVDSHGSRWGVGDEGFVVVDDDLRENVSPAAVS